MKKLDEWMMPGCFALAVMLMVGFGLAVFVFGIGG